MIFFKAVRQVGMVQVVKLDAVIVTMMKAVTRSTEHAPTDVPPVGLGTLATKVYR